jgi:hypothetical protein
MASKGEASASHQRVLTIWKASLDALSAVSGGPICHFVGVTAKVGEAGQPIVERLGEPGANCVFDNGPLRLEFDDENEFTVSFDGVTWNERRPLGEIRIAVVKGDMKGIGRVRKSPWQFSFESTVGTVTTPAAAACVTSPARAKIPKNPLMCGFNRQMVAKGLAVL